MVLPYDSVILPWYCHRTIFTTVHMLLWLFSQTHPTFLCDAGTPSELFCGDESNWSFWTQWNPAWLLKETCVNDSEFLTGFIWSDLRWNTKHPPVLPQPRLTWDQLLVSVRIGNQASAHLRQCRGKTVLTLDSWLLNLWIKSLAESNVMRKTDRAA